MSYSPDAKEKPFFSPGQEKGDVVPTLETGEYGRDPTNAFGQQEHEKLKHALLPRHLAMISIGGVIGTGLFLGSGGSLHNGGPLGLWLGYILIGTVCYSMMMCLGEMISQYPVPGGHLKLAERLVGKPFSLAVGWNYWYNWTIILPAELSAAAVLMTFWTDKNPAIWISIFLVLVVAINCAGTRVYGEAEFWFASIKVITIVGLIILSICIDLGAGDQGRLGFRYWKNPGPFAQYLEIAGSWGRFLGFFSVLLQASFSFIGTEIVAIAAGEARNPRKTVPSAIKKVWVRILIFYILGTFCIGLICPSNDPALTSGQKTTRSPFVIAIKAAGIKGLPSVINAALITSAVSAASSDLFTSSRALYGLAIAGNAPRIFARTTKSGLPYYAVGVSILFSSLAYMSVSNGAATVFGWFANMTSMAGLSTWTCIAIMHLRFRKGMARQNIPRSTLPFTARFSVIYAPWVIFMTTIVMFFSGFAYFLDANKPFSQSDFWTNYVPIPFFLVLFIGALIYYGRGSILRVDQIDFVTGLKELEDNEYEEEKPTTLWGKIWAVIA
ncbi:putative general amino acid permease [Jaminaea rosea]|uniref:Putative general amino acid permease n=1 Tax=Jaminaea rosea TaxID=1569628 RepID=A0A316URN4_9BASI|nr:putative general amino acid permease [Jaminaea rosea]PWN25795.1 putative general amino acid permease [Jaminaea rosea]